MYICMYMYVKCTYSKLMRQCMYIRTHIQYIRTIMYNGYVYVRMLSAIVCTYVYLHLLINSDISQNNNNNSEQQHYSLTRGYTSPLEGVTDLATPWESLLCEGLRF